MPILNKVTSLQSTRASAGSTLPEDGFLYDESGIPYEVGYLGKLSISASTDDCGMVAGSPSRLEFGSVPLSAIGTANQFSLAAPATANAATSTIPQGAFRFAFRAASSALTIFYNDASLGALSGTVTLGKVI
jgi:hypothetical protein